MTTQLIPTKTKVLVIEDDLLTRRMVSSVLEKLGYLMCDAVNGEAGIAAFMSEKPDIVLTDLHMPGKAGLVAISEIRKVNPKTPIIAMSSDAEGRGLLNLAEEIGARYQLKKPFTANELSVLLLHVREIMTQDAA